MKLQIIPVTASGAAPDPFELEISEASQVGQLKQSIEAMMGNQLWKVSTMGIFHRDRELQDTSTLLEYAINEMDPVTVVSCEVNNRVNFPTGDEDLFANVDPSIDVFFTIDELLGLQNEALDVKMILPYNFQATTELHNFTTHHIKTAGQLRDKVDNSPPSWLSKPEAFAILSNANTFVAENVHDYDNRRNGGVALVRSANYGEFLRQGPGYKHSLQETTRTVTIEKPAAKWKIAGEIFMDRYEIMGDLWNCRRVHLANDDTFSLIQWMTANPKQKDTMKEELSNVVKAVSEMTGQLNAVAGDVTCLKSGLTDVKTDLTSMKQSLTDIQMILAALVHRLPPQGS